MTPKVLRAVSDIHNGSMSKGVLMAEQLENRTKFLKRLEVKPEQSVAVYLKYEGSDYRRYLTVSKKDGGDGVTRESSMVADALFTRDANVALLLPIADCIGVILYDSINHIIGLSHLGRHNLLQDGGTSSVEYMAREFGSTPSTIQTWLSPAAGQDNYPLHDFNNRSLIDVAVEQLTVTGIQTDNIEIDERDTTTDETLFSHSQYLKGKRQTDGRQMVVAMMRL